MDLAPMKKSFWQSMLLFSLCCGFLSADQTETTSPQTVIDKAAETLEVLEARKNELSASYSRLSQQVQRMQFRANTYPSDSNQQRTELTSVATEYYDVLQAMILLCQLEIDGYDTQIKQESLNRSRKTSIRKSKSRIQDYQRSLTQERDKLLKEGFVKTS